MHRYEDKSLGVTTPPLCSECDPAIGKWHGQFPKVKVKGAYVEGKHGLLTLEQAECEKRADACAKDAKGIEHIGAEGIARTSFTRGWNYGAAYALRQGEGGKALRALLGLVEESLTTSFFATRDEWETWCAMFRERTREAVSNARTLIRDAKEG